MQTKMSAQLQTKIQDYLHSNPPDYRFQVDSLLELLSIPGSGVLPQISVFAFKHCHVYSIIIVILYRRLLDDEIRQYAVFK